MYSLDVSAVGLEGIRLRSQLHELHLLPLSSPSSPAGLSLYLYSFSLSEPCSHAQRHEESSSKLAGSAAASKQMKKRSDW
jgi:hypothetical protein